MARIVRTIQPKKRFKKAVFKKKIKEGLEETGKLILKEYEKTTRTFETKVKFTIHTRVFKQPFRVQVTTRNKIYKWINDGTKAHTIKPKKKGGVLVFPAKTVAKTTPRLISSRKGFKSKKKIFVRGPVRVKGIKARRFDIPIAKRIRPKFNKIMQRKLNEAVDATGYRRKKLRT